MRTHDGPHGGANYDDDCYGCVLKAKDLSYGGQCFPTRTRSGKPRPVKQPGWEAGVAGETRPDGSFMPYLHGNDLEPIGVKEMADNRRHFESERHRQLNDPAYGQKG